MVTLNYPSDPGDPCGKGLVVVLMDGSSGGSVVLAGILGGDGRLLARCAMRVYTSMGLDRLLVLVPEGSEGAALEYLEKLAREYLQARFEHASVGRGDFASIFLRVRRLLEEAGEGDRIVLCLSDAPAYAIVAALSAAATISPKAASVRGAVVEVDVEGTERWIEFPLKPLRVLGRAGDLDNKILDYVWANPDGRRLTDIADAVGLPKSTTWKILQRLVEGGVLVEKARRYYPVFPPGLGRPPSQA